MQSPGAGFKMTGAITAKARRTFKKSAGLYTLVGRMKKTRSKDLVFLELVAGLEPATCSLRVSCSTN